MKPLHIDCNHCEKKFYDYSEFHVHLKEKHDSQGLGEPCFTCEHCEKTFYNIPFYETHLEVFHEVLVEKRCKYCKEVFFHNDDFDKHTEFVHGSKSWSHALTTKSLRRYVEGSPTVMELEKGKFCAICGSESWCTTQTITGDDYTTFRVFGSCKKHIEEVRELRRK